MAELAATVDIGEVIWGGGADDATLEDGKEG